MRPRPIPGPDGLFNVTQRPRFLADSGAVGWAGAFFTDLWAAQAGTVDHGHARLCLQHWQAPFRARERRQGASWETMNPGLGIWLSGDEQRFDWEGGGSRQFLFVEPAYAQQVLDGSGRLARPAARPHQGVCSPVARAIVDALAADLREGSPAGALVGDSLVTALLVHLWGGDAGARAGAGLAPAVCRRVQAYIEERVASPVTLAELAGQARMSVRHFCRAFRASLGCSPHQYLLRQRVERAKAFIAAGRMPLAEIAQTTGFADQSQLTRTFRRHAGMSPAAYRAATR